MMSLSIWSALKPKLSANVFIRKWVPDRGWLATIMFEKREGDWDVMEIERTAAPLA
jgi:hypothetical protein